MVIEVLLLGLRGTYVGLIQNEELRRARLTVSLDASRERIMLQNYLHRPPLLFIGVKKSVLECSRLGLLPSWSTSSDDHWFSAREGRKGICLALMTEIRELV